MIADHAPIDDTRTGGDELLGVFYTGGTTGHPKGVMLSHDNLLVSALGSLSSGQFVSPGAGCCTPHRCFISRASRHGRPDVWSAPPM